MGHEDGLAVDPEERFRQRRVGRLGEVAHEEVLDALFEAAVDATEEALVNQLVAAKTMTGADGVTVYGLPHERLIALLKKYGRYSPTQR